MTVTREELKARVLTAIDQRRDWIVSIARTILEAPEAGFQEVETSRLVSQKMEELGIAHDRGIALTGIKGWLAGAAPGPAVAVIGELDALRVPAPPTPAGTTGRSACCSGSRPGSWGPGRCRGSREGSVSSPSRRRS
jgi:hypothetical protein